MNENNVTQIFRGFLNLTNLEKLRLTEKINEYFDAVEREPIRRAAESDYEKLLSESGERCKCCGAELK